MEAKICDTMDTYREQIDAAVSVIKTSMLTEFDDLHIPKFEAKTVGSNVPAREQTMVDASLQMADAMRHALCLKFPPRVSKLDVVLKAIVQAVASAGGNIVEMRKLRRQKLRVASNMVSDLNRELQALVPEFARPIAGHVNFALVEVLVRAVGWRHSTLVHNLISGFEPIGTVPSTECLRPVDEPEPGAMSKESNAQSFDDAVKHLSRKARDADESSLADQWAIWEKTLAECAEGFCVGPLSRSKVESMFKDTEFGPRCIPAFGIWQKGKLRRIDDACRSEHNFLTQMLETIVCVSADLPADIACEFYKFLPTTCRLRLGTDDIASAYRVLQSAAPQHNELTPGAESCWRNLAVFWTAGSCRRGTRLAFVASYTSRLLRLSLAWGGRPCRRSRRGSIPRAEARLSTTASALRQSFS